MVSQGLLFVWPDENGWEKATTSKPPILPSDFEDPESTTVTIQRDLFYRYDTLMENVSDPSHIEFAHHKMLDRYEQHTLKCSSCKGAYNAFQTLQKVLIAATVVLCATTALPSEMLLRAVLGGGRL
ncbi:hypothetical protein H6P81_017957 [Aristolochia fimbriata]|uniref:Uncharacterized protein n=1 Tax=Aristolochia fimbriata TaxID=158543 RepID=A0AAV7E028_ARIFI|nr:hypothetical protein H6P81_017957 [Aristolochia fimbriata]